MLECTSSKMDQGLEGRVRTMQRLANFSKDEKNIQECIVIMRHEATLAEAVAALAMKASQRGRTSYRVLLAHPTRQLLAHVLVPM